MTTKAISDLKTKNIFKQANLEVFQEEKEFFSDLFMEAMEDIALMQVMEEVDENDTFSRDDIFQILE